MRTHARTLATVAIAIHFAHCPQVTSGPGTGCAAHDPAPVGRFFPSLPSRASVLLFRIDESQSAIVPSARYIAPYEPPPVSEFTLIPQLAVGQCTCVRDADGKRCDSTDPVSSPSVDGGAPQPCEPLRILGLGAHRPCPTPDTCLPSCVVDDECPGEVCHQQLCSRPHVLTYDPAQGRHIPNPPTIESALLPDDAVITIQMLPTAILDPTVEPPKCPVETRNLDVRFVPRTTLLSPAAGAVVSRAQNLTVRWAGANAGYVLVQVRGRRLGVSQSVACRPLDRQSDEQPGFEVPAASLGELGPGPSTIEVLRMNAAQVVAPRVDSAVVYVTSARSAPITLE